MPKGITCNSIEEHMARFWSFVDIPFDNPNACWLWIGQAKTSAGYGCFSIKGKMFRAHRISMWFFGLITSPKDKIKVLHSCDIRTCVNPLHLFLGSQKDNLLDAMAKGKLIRIKETGRFNHG